MIIRQSERRQNGLDTRALGFRHARGEEGARHRASGPGRGADRCWAGRAPRRLAVPGFCVRVRGPHHPQPGKPWSGLGRGGRPRPPPRGPGGLCSSGASSPSDWVCGRRVAGEALLIGVVLAAAPTVGLMLPQLSGPQLGRNCPRDSWASSTWPMGEGALASAWWLSVTGCPGLRHQPAGRLGLTRPPPATLGSTGAFSLGQPRVALVLEVGVRAAPLPDTHLAPCSRRPPRRRLSHLGEGAGIRVPGSVLLLRPLPAVKAVTP